RRRVALEVAGGHQGRLALLSMDWAGILVSQHRLDHDLLLGDRRQAGAARQPRRRGDVEVPVGAGDRWRWRYSLSPRLLRSSQRSCRLDTQRAGRDYPGDLRRWADLVQDDAPGAGPAGRELRRSAAWVAAGRFARPSQQ